MQRRSLSGGRRCSPLAMVGKQRAGATHFGLEIKTI